ncbi:hypothetical protein SAMN05421763_103285 [[Luteovulum] sphaeroides subsp. megalophilum]|uniref:hypothetical protein n=1 Tax=Cereibacter sphaeroides TaxID=1063 RepID=UPI000B754AEE|nr:hypothetical protein [Cereibacter sphaeroides]SNS86943.1 hypothetical protein SAMN05421763_103285 [[Luteovulum] sphaeroides subsp. megalophilum]
MGRRQQLEAIVRSYAAAAATKRRLNASASPRTLREADRRLCAGWAGFAAMRPRMPVEDARRLPPHLMEAYVTLTGLPGELAAMIEQGVAVPVVLASPEFALLAALVPENPVAGA